jgi:hypothetical protein
VSDGPAPEAEIVVSAAARIATDLDVELGPSEITLEALRALVIQHVIHLLNRNCERLMAILYRIDVSELRVNEIFNTALPLDVPELLADLIIERQLAKAVTRRQAAGGSV